MRTPTPFDVAAMCEGKESFATPQIARKVVRKRHRRGIPVESYRCHVCQQWHLGNLAAPNRGARLKAEEANRPPRGPRNLRELEAWDGDVTFGESE